MESGTAVKIEFWTPQYDGKLGDEEGINEFRAELAADYVSVVQGRPRPLGGGVLHYLIVDVLSSITLADVARLLVEGVAFDVIKHGTKSLVLKPLLRAYETLKNRNKPGEVDITEFRITFQDAEIRIKSIADGTLTTHLEGILRAVAQHYERLRRLGEDALSSITVPVFEDRTEERVCRFREIGEIEEPIASSGPADYYAFWGVDYGYGIRRVYDVQRQLVIDEEWLTLSEYWQRVDMRDLERRQNK